MGDKKGTVFGGLVEAPLQPSSSKKYQVLPLHSGKLFATYFPCTKYFSNQYCRGAIIALFSLIYMTALLYIVRQVIFQCIHFMVCKITSKYGEIFFLLFLCSRDIENIFFFHSLCRLMSHDCKLLKFAYCRCK